LDGKEAGFFLLRLEPGHHLEKMKFTAKTIRVVEKSGVNPLISNSGEKISTSQTKNMAITRVKRLKVTILKGKVIFLRRGLTAKFKMPKRIPAKVKVVRKRLISAVLVGKTNKGPVKWTLGTNL
jgi:hypothetical protein